MIARPRAAPSLAATAECRSPSPGKIIGLPPPAHPRPGPTWPRTVALSRQALTGALDHPVLRGLLPVSAGFVQAAAPAEPITGIDAALFIYCTRGRGWCDLEGRRHEIRPGDLLVIPPRATRSFGAHQRQPWAISWVQALGANLEFFLAELGATARGPVLPLGEDTRLLALFHEVAQALEGGWTHARLLYAAQALAHLLGAAVWRRCDAARGEPDVGRKIEQSKAYMQQHLDQSLQVATLAALTNLSPSHYTRLFKDHTGCAPIDYFIRLRMEHAAHLLAATCLSVKEVAAALGYADQFYFSRVFKSVNHVSPSEYRVPVK